MRILHHIRRPWPFFMWQPCLINVISLVRWSQDQAIGRNKAKTGNQNGKSTNCCEVTWDQHCANLEIKNDTKNNFLSIAHFSPQSKAERMFPRRFRCFFAPDTKDLTFQSKKEIGLLRCEALRAQTWAIHAKVEMFDSKGSFPEHLRSFPHVLVNF